MRTNPEAHKTALRRIEPSAPLRLLLSRSEVVGRILDFGCGHGKDAEHLRSLGFQVDMYDPHWFPDKPTGKFDTVLCTYVINVVPTAEERRILATLRSYAKKGGRLFVTVRTDVENSKSQRLVSKLPGFTPHTSNSGFRIWTSKSNPQS